VEVFGNGADDENQNEEIERIEGPAEKARRNDTALRPIETS